MKDQENYSVNALSTLLLTTAILLSISCANNQNDKTVEQPVDSEVESKPQPPNVDIHTAALMGNTQAIQQHIEAGTDLNTKDAYGSTPLIIAATFGKTAAARVLIEAGADLGITNNDGSTALHSAAFLGRKDIVQMLLDHGADKEVKNKYGSTPRESVLGPFEQVRPIYDQFSKDLGPLGLRLVYDELKKDRSIIADMLK